MSSARHDLSRVLDLKDALALAFGAMVGWSWVVVFVYGPVCAFTVCPSRWPPKSR